MPPKVMIWTGVGLIALVLVILGVWAGLAGFFPRIDIQVQMPEINLTPARDWAVNALNQVAQAIGSVLGLIANFLQVSVQQLVGAFTMPSH